MKETVRIIRFVIVGTLNAIIAALVVWLLMDICNLDYMIANISAYTAAQINNFLWCKYWIFPLDKETKKNSIQRQTKNQNVSLDVLGKICCTLDCKIDDILEFISESEDGKII